MALSFDEHEAILNRAAEALDIPPSKYQIAVDRYEAVGRWLEGGKYEGCGGGVPHIFTQGSFALGTVIRPLVDGKEADYDIDLVCQLPKKKANADRGRVKQEVGERLAEHGKYKEMLEPEGRRCWTLQYAESDGIGFHLDVLPSIPEDEDTVAKIISMGVSPDLANDSVAITHKDKVGGYEWRSSNPEGYARWFKGRMQDIMLLKESSERERIFTASKGVFAKVEDVPPQLIRTPLQKAIQILKRHRDSRFRGRHNEDAKPISMVITTLAALLYNNERTLVDTLRNIVLKIESHASLLKPDWLQRQGEFSASMKAYGGAVIERQANGRWNLPNPVNPSENFADRWHEEDHRRAKAFFEWVSLVKEDLVKALGTGNEVIMTEAMNGALGERVGEEALIAAAASAVPTVHILSPDPVKIEEPAKPWLR